MAAAWACRAACKPHARAPKNPHTCNAASCLRRASTSATVSVDIVAAAAAAALGAAAAAAGCGCCCQGLVLRRRALEVAVVVGAGSCVRQKGADGIRRTIQAGLGREWAALAIS